MGHGSPLLVSILFILSVAKIMTQITGLTVVFPRPCLVSILINKYRLLFYDKKDRRS